MMNGYELDLELLNRKKNKLNIEIKASKLELANVAKQIRNVKVNMFRSKVTSMFKKSVDKFRDIVNTSVVDRVNMAGFLVAQTIFNSKEKTLDFKNRIVNFKNDKVNKVKTSLSNISTVTKNKVEEVMYNLSHILELKNKEEIKNTPMQDLIDKNVGIIRDKSNINKNTTMFKAPLANIDLKAKKIIYDGASKVLKFENRAINLKNNAVIKVRSGVNKISSYTKDFVNDKVNKIKSYFVPDIDERKALIEQLQTQKEVILKMKEQNRELNHEGYKKVKVRERGFLNTTPLLFFVVFALSLLAFCVALLMAKQLM